MTNKMFSFRRGGESKQKKSAVGWSAVPSSILAICTSVCQLKCKAEKRNFADNIKRYNFVLCALIEPFLTRHTPQINIKYVMPPIKWPFFSTLSCICDGVCVCAKGTLNFKILLVWMAIIIMIAHPQRPHRRINRQNTIIMKKMPQRNRKLWPQPIEQCIYITIAGVLLDSRSDHKKRAQSNEVKQKKKRRNSSERRTKWQNASH